MDSPTPDSPPLDSPTPDAPITLWLVEDDPRFASTIRRSLTDEPGFEVLTWFDSAEAVYDTLPTVRAATAPTVALLDYQLPGDDGDRLATRIKTALPDVGVVMLTSTDTRKTVIRALRAGASGYVLKDDPFEALTRAIREVASGGMLMPPGVAEYVRDHFEAAPAPDLDLTEREIQILDLMAKGLVQKEIAEALSRSPHTIDSHLRKIYAKLHVSSGIAAVAAALRLNLID